MVIGDFCFLLSFFVFSDFFKQERILHKYEKNLLKKKTDQKKNCSKVKPAVSGHSVKGKQKSQNRHSYILCPHLYK